MVYPLPPLSVSVRHTVYCPRYKSWSFIARARVFWACIYVPTGRLPLFLLARRDILRIETTKGQCHEKSNLSAVPDRGGGRGVRC